MCLLVPSLTATTCTCRYYYVMHEQDAKSCIRSPCHNQQTRVASLLSRQPKRQTIRRRRRCKKIESACCQASLQLCLPHPPPLSVRHPLYATLSLALSLAEEEWPLGPMVAAALLLRILCCVPARPGIPQTLAAGREAREREHKSL